ncbi:Carbon monoxide dehydrogenase subunit G [Pseudonocardia thermophila]|uniref:Carbon monoxide dehydrogenase subunit G n=1 Tax=Pseudonocardia thermophila TaxID=1848 RepID=A0A1M6WVB0_PSETH|nr:SRPBCC family protein [Pseudonocardia thermophila]SHK97509.1 Carbon monoxide dehydrogenase subunit G [Pseudonocardia thermophila]
MILENEFTLSAPIADVWTALNEPELVAPCFPGADLTSCTGDSFTGIVKVKLGPISLTYRGEGAYVERDDANHTVVIAAKGRDARGNGTAEALVTGELVELAPGECRVRMRTDMSITGRPAQFGRGVIADVADSIIGRFADCLAAKLVGGEPPAAPDPAPVRPLPAADAAGPSGDAVLDVADIVKAAVPKQVQRVAPVVVAILLLLAVLVNRRASR